ncbi:MAG: HEAT repeat domain-containing protein [Gemmatimonadetes bacterium]|nr:HEAT repeat domain-containing protein [Gemmatimonadota bacterium]
MKRRLIPLLVLAGCAPAAQLTPAPAPAPTPAAATMPTRVDTPAAMRVPPFRTGPLMTWGPVPEGTPHAERTRTYDLQHQVVHVRFDWPRHAVVGSTTLRLAALDRPLTDVAVDALGMTIRRVTGPSGASLRHDYDGRTLTVHLPRPLAPGAATSVTIDYEAVRPKKGAYFIDRRHMLWTQGEMEDTRYWVPTYDFPNDKATWEFFVRTAANEKALSNGRLVGSRKVGNEVEWHWSLERPASTYLMSVVTGDYVVVQDRWNDVPVGYWTYPDSVEAARRGFGMTPRAMEVFSRKTGVPYPWNKYDQSVTPDYVFGGMENVTATTQLDNGILHPAWAEPQAYSGGLVSHELGHQWYGDLLTTSNWAHAWLNEGFATFMEQTFREASLGHDEGALDRLEAQEQTIGADRGSRRPIVWDRWMTDPLEVFLSGHIYPKGATVLQMPRHQLGDSLFWAAMNHYTTAHAYQNVTTPDLQRAFEETTGRSYDAFFRQWVYGAGFPVFQVSYAYDPASRRVALDAREVQPRDSLTGVFDADVDVEVLTDAGPVRGVVPVRDGTGRLELALPAEPRSIRWDKGGWLLDLTDFPRPTTMLAYQLEHDDDVIGRIEAVELLAERGEQPEARAALGRAVHSDAFWGVRQRAANALAGITGAEDVRAALVDATRDRDARVRQAAAGALGAFSGDASSARLTEVAASDPSPYVRAAAVRSLAHAAPAAALPTIRAVLAQDSWLDVLRAGAINALGSVDPATARELLRDYLGASNSRQARQAAIPVFAAQSKGTEAESARILEPLLDDPDFYVRQAAAKALGELGQASSVAPLRARLRTEAESRVINEINASVRRIQRGASGR